MFHGIDSKEETILVTQLSTPLGAIDHAALRVSDVSRVSTSPWP